MLLADVGIHYLDQSFCCRYPVEAEFTQGDKVLSYLRNLSNMSVCLCSQLDRHSHCAMTMQCGLQGRLGRRDYLPVLRRDVSRFEACIPSD